MHVFAQSVSYRMKSPISKFSNNTRQWFLLLIIAMIATTVTSAFAIVWIQQQINRTARSSVLLENELAEMVDKLRYLDERISKFHQPVVLQGKIAGRLRPATDRQVAWVAERNAPNGRVYVYSEPYKVSTDLAFINLKSQP